MRRFSMFGRRSSIVMSLAVLVAGTGAFAGTPDPTFDAGYLDRFDLRDGRQVDIGALGGGLEGNSATKKIFISPQSGAWESDGALTGIVHGKLRVNNLVDRNNDGFINGGDLNLTYDVSWQLITNDKNGGVAFVADTNGAVNLPPEAGGTGSTWNLAACSSEGNFDVGNGLQTCNQFAYGPAVNGLQTSYTGFVDYTFPVRVPGNNPQTPGLVPSNDHNYVLTALVGLTSLGGGAVTYGPTAAFNPNVGVTEANADLFGPNTFLNLPGEQANIPLAGLLTSIEIVVTPEPTSIALLGMGAFALIRRRRA